MLLERDVASRHSDLVSHPVYQSLNSVESIRIFMKYHVFAVWDFMSLLKALQKEITCVNVPWRDSEYSPEIVRVINEIVLSEESDLDSQGRARSHFSLYLDAMKEVGADTSLISGFISDLIPDDLPRPIREMLSFHLGLASSGQVHEVASSFFFGREKIIPEMFQSIVDVMKGSGISCGGLIYYFERHIELDGGEHSHMAERCLEELITSNTQRGEAILVAKKSLEIRSQLWDFIKSEIDAG
ncbi:MAG: DUF3050 domain-containing protein [Bdellovibrionales bacterium]|nr:DUF3050 domain-containing protein [Bdellovibrionales bacterium]